MIISFVDELLPKTSVPHELIEKVEPTLTWDIMLVCFEEEYRDLVQSLFFIPYLEPWYAAGHFPCFCMGQHLVRKNPL